MAIEWMKHGKPSMLGAATGAIAGLAAITISGTAGPLSTEDRRHVGFHLLVCSTAIKQN